MQTKEKKWVEVENYLMSLYDNNEELYLKMQELKITTDQEISISNIITENERLNKTVTRLKKKLRVLRKRLINPYFV